LSSKFFIKDNIHVFSRFKLACFGSWWWKNIFNYFNKILEDHFLSIYFNKNNDFNKSENFLPYKLTNKKAIFTFHFSLFIIYISRSFYFYWEPSKHNL
jgi:hypothetical protein